MAEMLFLAHIKNLYFGDLMVRFAIFRESRCNPLLLAILLATSVGAGGRVAAQESPAAVLPKPALPATAAAASPDSKTATASRLDAMIENTRQFWQVPGIAVAVVKDGEVLLSKGYGTRSVDHPEPVDGDTLFAIASNSKAFTTAALAILVEEGKLSWDDRVRKHLPWFELYDPYVSDEMRVRDLVCHRSGLGTFSGDLLWYGTGYSTQEILQRVKNLKPEGPFRSHYGYSNVMFLAAGEVIEKVSGKSWSEFIQERFFEPLHMKRSITSVRDLVVRGNYATPHKTWPDRSEPITWVNWDPMVAAGGIISSSNDMSNWLKLQLKRGQIDDQKRLFSEASSHEMWESHTPIKLSMRSSQRFPTTHFRAYGLGWMLSDYKGRKLVSHGGGYDGMYSQVALVPEEQLGIVVLTNSMTSLPDSLVHQILDLFLGGDARDWNKEDREQFLKARVAFRQRIDKAIEPVAQGTSPSHPLAAYTGTFNDPLYGKVKIELEGEKLLLRMLPNPELVADLTHLHYDTFVLRWRNRFAWFDEGTAHFVANAKGVFIKLQLDVPNDDLWFHELNLMRQ